MHLPCTHLRPDSMISNLLESIMTGIRAMSGSLCIRLRKSCMASVVFVASSSAPVFALSWWLGLYLLARNVHKPVLVLAAAGLIAEAGMAASRPLIAFSSSCTPPPRNVPNELPGVGS